MSKSLGRDQTVSPEPALGTVGAIWYVLSPATVPFGDAKGNGVSRRRPTKPRLPPQLCVGSERPKLISHWETGKAGRKRRRRMVHSTIRRKHPPARRPAAASVAQPPNGEYSAERTPVSATREARLRERDGLWPQFGRTRPARTVPGRAMLSPPANPLPRHTPTTTRGVRGCATSSAE